MSNPLWPEVPGLRPAADCADMAELRVEIDRLDTALVGLLGLRSGYIARAAEIKSTSGLPARITSRVEEVVSHVRARSGEAGLDPDLAEALWRRIIDWAIEHEETVLGPSDAAEAGWTPGG